jgi:prepilin-type N-terminal cleavage/methylation domain-containing protein
MVRRGRARGFTLMELLIAMGLSTVGLLGLLALQTIAIRGNMMSRGMSEAIVIAQSQIEQAQRTPYTSLSTMVEGTCAIYTLPTPPNCTGHPSITVSPDPHTTTQQVYTRCTAVAVDSVNKVTTVQVSVCWQDTSNLTHAITMYAKRSP